MRGLALATVVGQAPNPDAARPVLLATLKQPDAALRVVSNLMSMAGAEFSAKLAGDSFDVHSPLVGEFNVHNTLAAIAAALYLGLPAEEVLAGLREFAGVPGRLQRVSTDDQVHVFIDYAHTDDSLDKMLEAIKPHCRGKLVVVFGAGGDRDRGKRELMGKAAAKHADRLVVTSDNPRSEDPDRIIGDIRTGIPAGKACVSIVDRRAAIRTAIAEAQPEDTIVVAGKGHEDYIEYAGGRKVHFSDFEESRAALAARRSR